MSKLLDHIYQMEKLRLSEWRLNLPTDSYRGQKQSTPMIKNLSDKELAQELRKRGYIVVKVIEQE